MGGDLETLATDREPEYRRPRRVSVGLAASACLAVAAAAWAGGRWLSERQANQEASRQVAVQFVLHTAEVHLQDTGGSSKARVGEVTGILVNSGPRSVVVQRFTWGGGTAIGPFSLAQQGASSMLSLSTPVDCRPSGGRVAMPVAKIRVSTTGGVLTDQSATILNPDVWDQAIGQACFAPTAEDGLVVASDVREIWTGSELTITVDVRNDGPSATLVSPGLDAEGFLGVAAPFAITLSPGQIVHAVLHVTVVDCRKAQTGQVSGLTFSPSFGVGADSNLIRQLDRLATRTCTRP